MVKRTKTQKKALLDSMQSKAKELFLHGLISANNVDSIVKICKSAYKKL
jgi:uncharacterized protein YueI